MSDFLDRADELLRRRELQGDGVGPMFENVFSAISDLQGVYAKSHLDLDNLEAVFGAIEMAVLLGKFPNREPTEIQTLRNDLVTLIYKTLESSVRFSARKRQILPPKPYDEFVKRLYRRRPGSLPPPARRIDFITFNYDLALDYALHWMDTRFSYGLSAQPPAVDSMLLKLHGSVNWGECQECGEIVPFEVKDARFQIFNDSDEVRFDLGSKLPTRSHCEKSLALPPVIVPPTWNKTQYHGRLGNVWSNAAAVLGNAENVFILGFSLPETDSFFRYLYSLGSESDTRIKRFWVFDPDPNGTVERRYRSLIGRGIENRFEFFNQTFSEALPRIGAVLGAA